MAAEPEEIRKELEQEVSRLIEKASAKPSEQLQIKNELLKLRKGLYSAVLVKWKDSIRDGSQNLVWLAEPLSIIDQIFDSLDTILDEIKKLVPPREGPQITKRDKGKANK